MLTYFFLANKFLWSTLPLPLYSDAPSYLYSLFGEERRVVKSDDCVVSAHIPAQGLSIIWLGLVSTPPYVEFQSSTLASASARP
jgi:hypothetical protein